MHTYQCCPVFASWAKYATLSSGSCLPVSRDCLTAKENEDALAFSSTEHQTAALCGFCEHTILAGLGNAQNLSALWDCSHCTHTESIRADLKTAHALNLHLSAKQKHFIKIQIHKCPAKTHKDASNHLCQKCLPRLQTKAHTDTVTDTHWHTQTHAHT